MYFVLILIKIFWSFANKFNLQNITNVKIDITIISTDLHSKINKNCIILKSLFQKDYRPSDLSACRTMFILVNLMLT